MTAAVERVPASADGTPRQRSAGLGGIRGLAAPYLPHGPMVVVYEEFGPRRLHSGPGAFLVTAALAVPPAILLARIFAVLEIPFVLPRTRPRSARPHHPEHERVLA